MKNTSSCLTHQRGLSMFWVATGSAVLALAAMAALFSMRYERNLFAEGLGKISASAIASPVGKAADAAKNAVKGDAKASASASGGELRRCVIDGKTVISNVDCSDKNPTSKKIIIRDTKGFDSGKKTEPAASAPAASAPTSQPAVDKLIEKQLQ
jgi:hypothetical protein